MNVDLQMLIAVSLILLAHPLISVAAYLKHWGMVVAVGNRENTPELPPWANRALRAHANLVENYAHFAVFVLIVNYLDISNEATAAGATIFFWARLAYLFVYLAGISWVRTGLFVLSVIGEIIIVREIIINFV